MEQEQSLDFTNIGEGTLATELQEHYKSLLANLFPGEKGTISINLTFARMKDATTMVVIEHSIVSKTPKRKKQTIAQIAGDENGEMILKVEAPPKKADVKQLKLVGEGGK
jgi:hypothetical protein